MKDFTSFWISKFNNKKRAIFKTQIALGRISGEEVLLHTPLVQLPEKFIPSTIGALTMVPHISICICTYKRPEFLDTLLPKLQELRTSDLFTYSILVVDNDHAQSARNKVESYIEVSEIKTEYYHEPENGISNARNKAIDNAQGDFIAFIDDDEYPTTDWLFLLFTALQQHEADASLGPVIPDFEKKPPKWVIESKLFDRPRDDTGLVLPWTKTRTGNILLKRDIFGDKKNRFDPRFGKTGGEDRELFFRLIKQGQKFIWCDEAIVFETIPPKRWQRSFLLKRALMNGSIHRWEAGKFNISKSIIALLVYAFLLPFFLIIGQHLFMRYLVKFCNHLGIVLSVVGFNLFHNKDYYFVKEGTENAEI